LICPQCVDRHYFNNESMINIEQKDEEEKRREEKRREEMRREEMR
jgi:hypothetical protein